MDRMFQYKKFSKSCDEKIPGVQKIEGFVEKAYKLRYGCMKDKVYNRVKETE